MTEGIFDLFAKKKEKAMKNDAAVINSDGTVTLNCHLIEILDFDPSDAS
jgi:hypothetical protein